MAFKTQVIDRGWRRIVKSLGSSDGSHTDIGFLEGELRDPDEQNNVLLLAQVAAFNEFGSPARPFMKFSVDANKQKISSFILSTQRAVIDGSITVRQGLDRNGVFMKSLIQKMIRDLRNPPNAPETVRRKGSSNPLIDTAQMLNGVDHKIFLSKNPKKLRAA